MYEASKFTPFPTSAPHPKVSEDTVTLCLVMRSPGSQPGSEQSTDNYISESKIGSTEQNSTDVLSNFPVCGSPGAWTGPDWEGAGAQQTQGSTW